MSFCCRHGLTADGKYVSGTDSMKARGIAEKFVFELRYYKSLKANLN